MVTEVDIRKMVEEIIRDMGRDAAEADEEKARMDKSDPQPAPVVPEKSADSDRTGAQPIDPSEGCEECLPDLAEVNLREQCLVPHPFNREALLSMKQSTPARVGVWRAGPRYKTETLLRFRADHAAAQDAVFNDVPEEFLTKNNLEVVQTECVDKDQFITRPDLGRQFSEESKAAIKRIVGAAAPRVLVYVSDGLSSTAVAANSMDALKTIAQGLERQSITLPKPFFVRFGRVPAMDVVSEVTGAEVVCVLIGERPGLVTAESMSAYITYKGTVGMPEARRTVVSNIHSGGTPAVEAGAYIADIIKMMLEKKVSGIDLKL